MRQKIITPTCATESQQLGELQLAALWEALDALGGLETVVLVDAFPGVGPGGVVEADHREDSQRSPGVMVRGRESRGFSICRPIRWVLQEGQVNTSRARSQQGQTNKG